MLTAGGAVTVKAPRVNDKRIDPDTGERQRFSSAILPAWVRESPQMNEVLPLLCLVRHRCDVRCAMVEHGTTYQQPTASAA